MVPPGHFIIILILFNPFFYSMYTMYSSICGNRLIIIRPFCFSENTEGSEGGPKGKKEWVMNPNGKSNVCILHEYVQHALKKQPGYEFKELGNFILFIVCLLFL